MLPGFDFEINATGTLNVLEAMRLAGIGALLIYASTNKVHGEMSDIAVRKEFGRYCYGALPLAVSEQRPLDFHSPYGCSKGRCMAMESRSVTFFLSKTCWMRMMPLSWPVIVRSAALTTSV